MKSYAGGCLCGAVRYQITADAGPSRICWCRDCQRISSNGTVNVIFPSDAITVTGTPGSHEKKADSGNTVTRRFCTKCGSQLFSDSSGRPGLTVVRVGTLDDPSAIKPTTNIWAASAPSWACLDQSLEQFQGPPAAGSPPRSDAGATGRNTRLTSEYFRSRDTAARYDRYRPRVHAIFLDWLASAGLHRRFRHAVDIACGTGHSTLPLLHLAEQVDGIDISAGMVEVARSNGLPARVGTYGDLPANAYDFINVCMAFHWFDREEAVRNLLRASAPEAIWLISNFWLHGHASDEHFNQWYRSWYASHFPAPQRRDAAFRPAPDQRQVALIAEGSGTFQVAFDRQGLIGYLTTQSNVESRLRAGYDYAQAEQDLGAHLPAIQDSARFLYGYQYTICRARP